MKCIFSTYLLFTPIYFHNTARDRSYPKVATTSLQKRYRHVEGIISYNGVKAVTYICSDMIAQKIIMPYEPERTDCR